MCRNDYIIRRDQSSTTGLLGSCSGTVGGPPPDPGGGFRDGMMGALAAFISGEIPAGGVVIGPLVAKGGPARFGICSISPNGTLRFKADDVLLPIYVIHSACE